MTVQTQIRIDAEIKEKSATIFKKLGLDMSTAINIFLNQCVLKGGLPFNVEIPDYNLETLEAMKEAKELSNNPKAKRYKTTKELFDDLDK